SLQHRRAPRQASERSGARLPRPCAGLNERLLSPRLHAQGAEMRRKVIGDPKTGLALQIQQTPHVMTLAGRPDPLLLIVVLGALVSVGIIGTIASSPRQGVLSFVLFSFLFLPLICVLAFNALRIRTLCVLDKEGGVLRIQEQSYTRQVREEYPMEE